MVINIDNISCGYGQKSVITDLNFSFQSGEAVCILGANGIGKTTLFKTLLGQIDVLNGNINVDGTPLTHLNLKERARIFSYVPQAKNYSYQFSVEDIVLMGRAIYIKEFSAPSREDYQVVADVLKRLHILDYAKKKYDELSGGEQQIVLLARAIAQQAKYILLDEPASNLDYCNQKKLIDVIKMLTAEGIGVLMVSHIPEHAFICCEKTLLINRNSTYYFGITEEVITERNLSDIYGVDIGIMQFKNDDGTPKYTCYLK